MYIGEKQVISRDFKICVYVCVWVDVYVNVLFAFAVHV